MTEASATMEVFRVTYMYRGDKYDGGQFDTREQARERARYLGSHGFTGSKIEPLEHTHHRFCGHEAR